MPGLATRLGYSERHLNRVLTAELGAGPLALARAHRAHTARLLIETTPLGMADVAFAAGFASVRQFNDTVRAVYGVAPTTLRAEAGRRRPTAAAGTLVLRLPFRPPFDAEGLLRFFAARAVAGVETLGDDGYVRTLRLPHGAATVALQLPDAGGSAAHVTATLRLADPRDLGPAVARVRRLLDLDADPVAVDELLGADPGLAKAVEEVPGIRLPGSVDGAETAIRTLLGQQVSVAAARTAAARLAEALGERLPPALASPGAELLFPTPAAIAEHGAEVLTGPARRIASVLHRRRGARRRHARARPRARPRRPARRAGRAARRRAVDRGLPRDARARRPRRAAGRRPRRPARRRRPRPAVRHPRPDRARRGLAPLAVLRRHPPLEESMSTWNTYDTPMGPFTAVVADGTVLASGLDRRARRAGPPHPPHAAARRPAAGRARRGRRRDRRLPRR